MPEVRNAGHLIDYLFEVGPVSPGAMGAIAVPWAELSGWMQTTCTVLTSWEARVLRQLSLEYAHWSRKGEDPECPAPWTARDVDQKTLVEGLDKALEHFMEPKRKSLRKK